MASSLVLVLMLSISGLALSDPAVSRPKSSLVPLVKKVLKKKKPTLKAEEVRLHEVHGENKKSDGWLTSDKGVWWDEKSDGWVTSDEDTSDSNSAPRSKETIFSYLGLTSCPKGAAGELTEHNKEDNVRLSMRASVSPEGDMKVQGSRHSKPASGLIAAAVAQRHHSEHGRKGHNHQDHGGKGHHNANRGGQGQPNVEVDEADSSWAGWFGFGGDEEQQPVVQEPQEFVWSYDKDVDAFQSIGKIKLGSEGTFIDVIMDTGSSAVVAITERTQPVQGDCPQAVDLATTDVKLYNPCASQTYIQTMNSDTVNEISFGSGTAAVLEGREDMEIGGKVLQQTSFSEDIVDNICVMHMPEKENGNFQGIVGLMHTKKGLPHETEQESHSVFHRMREELGTTAFSVCYRPGQARAHFQWFHDQPHERITFPVVSRSIQGEVKVPVIGQIHWGVSMKNVGAKGDAKNAVCQEGCAAVVDTGTSVLVGPKKQILALNASLGVKEDCSNFDELPHLSISLGGHEFLLPPSAYVMKMNVQMARESMTTQNIKIQFPGHKAYEVTIPVPENVPAGERQVCMLAAMADEGEGSKVKAAPGADPMDLWILGAPFFQEYYVRFSWLKQKDAEPTLFIAKAETACGKTGSLAATPKGKRGPRVIRSSQDIRYPNWLNGITQI